MTIVIGTVTDTHMWIGADRGLSDSSWIDAILNPKVFQKEQYLFGYCGSAGLGQLMNSSFEFPFLRTVDDMYNLFQPAMRQFYIDQGIRNDDSELLICAMGYVFTMYPGDSSIYQFKEAAVGSGSPYSLGYMHGSNKKGRSRILGALNTAVSLSPSCIEPFDVMSIAL